MAKKPSTNPEADFPENKIPEIQDAPTPTVSKSTVTKETDPVADYPLKKGHALLVALDADGKEIPGSEFTVIWNASAIKTYGNETQFKTKKKPTSAPLP